MNNNLTTILLFLIVSCQTQSPEESKITASYAQFPPAFETTVVDKSPDQIMDYSKYHAHLFENQQGGLGIAVYISEDSSWQIVDQFTRLSVTETIDKDSYRRISHAYSLDKEHVYGLRVFSSYALMSVISNTPDSFKVFEDTDYAMDENHVYYKGGVIQEADLESFRPIYTYSQDDKGAISKSSWWALDRKNVYYQNKIAEEEDLQFTDLPAYLKKIGRWNWD